MVVSPANPDSSRGRQRVLGPSSPRGMPIWRGARIVDVLRAPPSGVALPLSLPPSLPFRGAARSDCGGFGLARCAPPAWVPRRSGCAVACMELCDGACPTAPARRTYARGAGALQAAASSWRGVECILLAAFGSYVCGFARCAPMEADAPWASNLDVCPACAAELRPQPVQQIEVVALHETTAMQLRAFRCGACGMQVYPWFCRDARGWDRVLPADAAAPRPLLYPLTQSIWLHPTLLEWFDGLFLIGGISGHDFLLCRNAVFGGGGGAVRRSPFFAVYLHFVLVESLLDTAWMAGFFGAPSAVRLRLSGRAVDRSLALQLACQQLFPVLRQAFEERWVSTHAAWCGPACASSILVDGNEKLVPHGCCFAERGLDGRTAFCLRAPRRGHITCGIAEHRAQEEHLLQVHAARLRDRRRQRCGLFSSLLFLVVFWSAGLHAHTLVVAGGSRVQRGLRLHKCGHQRRVTATPARPAASAPTSVAASFVRPSAVALSCLRSASMWLNLCRRWQPTWSTCCGSIQPCAPLAMMTGAIWRRICGPMGAWLLRACRGMWIVGTRGGIAAHSAGRPTARIATRSCTTGKSIQFFRRRLCRGLWLAWCMGASAGNYIPGPGASGGPRGQPCVCTRC